MNNLKDIHVYPVFTAAGRLSVLSAQYERDALLSRKVKAESSRGSWTDERYLFLAYRYIDLFMLVGHSRVVSGPESSVNLIYLLSSHHLGINDPAFITFGKVGKTDLNFRDQ